MNNTVDEFMHILLEMYKPDSSDTVSERVNVYNCAYPISFEGINFWKL